jgi:hypothetical protein
MKHSDLRDMFNKAFKGVCTSTIVSPDPFIPPSTSPALKILENAEKDTDESEGGIQMDYFSNLSAQA